MNRQEALTRLRLRSHQAFCEYVENGNQENEEAALDVLAYDMAIAALRTTQLDENGLMPCGCGERAMILGLQGFCYECIACGTTTRNFETEAQAKAAWNTAMGWKGGAI